MNNKKFHLFMISLTIFIFIIYLFFHTFFFLGPIENFFVSGPLQHKHMKQVHSIISCYRSDTILSIDIKSLQDRLSEISDVLHVRIRRALPSSIYIEIDVQFPKSDQFSYDGYIGLYPLFFQASKDIIFSYWADQSYFVKNLFCDYELLL